MVLREKGEAISNKMRYDSLKPTTQPIFERMPGRKWLLLGVVGSLVFVLYGSLVPLDFQYRPLHDAWTEFKALLSDGFFFRSRTDLGANFLLMVPAGFFGFGFLWSCRRDPWLFFFAVTVWIMCLSASVAVEFLQLFFRGRTPAFSDILMQAIGSAVGITAWWLWGWKIWTRYFRSSSSGPPMSMAEKILWIYLIALFGYNTAPLDLNISPYAIYQKFKAGRIILIPFSFEYKSAIEFLYAISTDVAIWIPTGFLLLLSGKKTPFKAWLWTLSAITITEGVQLFVASRIFSITDIITGAIGGAVGVFAYLKMPLPHMQSTQPSTQFNGRYKLTWIGLGLFFIWSFALMLLFWYPHMIFTLSENSLSPGLIFFFGFHFTLIITVSHSRPSLQFFKSYCFLHLWAYSWRYLPGLFVKRVLSRYWR